MVALSLLSLIGCSGGPYAAPYGSSVDLQDMSEFEFAIDGGYLVPSDRIGALLKFQALATRPDSHREEGMPLNNVQVEIFSAWAEAYLLPETAVRAVDDYEVECEESGAVDDEDDPCNAWFDEASDTWVEFGGDYTDLDNFRPTYYSGATDNRGLLSFYVFIDSVPVDEGGDPVNFSIYASIGVNEDSFTFEF